MQLLGFTSAAVESDDAFDSILSEVTAAASSLPFTVGVDWADAMLGASLPTVLLHVASAAALAVTLTSAPKTFRDNFPEWKRYFDLTVEFAKDRFEKYAVDQRTATILALECAIREAGGHYEEIDIIFALRHYHTSLSGLQDLKMEGGRTIDVSPEGNVEAAMQFVGRYLFGIEVDGFRNFTIIIEADGTCSFARELK